MLKTTPILLALSVLIPACQHPTTEVREPSTPPPSPAQLDESRSFGEPFAYENLSLWPVYSRRTEDLGRFVTLHGAQADGLAEIRERGGEQALGQTRIVAQSDEPAQQRRASQAQQTLQTGNSQGQLLEPSATWGNDVIEQGFNLGQSVGGSATVGELVIQNRGQDPIFVPAGTVVKGGNQDRQIGQDLVIAPGETLPVAAFCVEQSRWSNERDGVATQGKFASTGVVSPKKIRASAQYDSDQSAVWSNVLALNGRASKAPATGTFLATLEEEDSVRIEHRAEMRKNVEAYFHSLEQDGLVGFAYAINGEPVTVRTFAHPRIFRDHFPSYVQTMSLEADLVSVRDEKAGKEPWSGTADLAAVQALVTRVNVAEATVREVAGNRSLVRSNEFGGNSAFVLIDGAREITISEDWTAPVTYTTAAAQAMGGLGYTSGDK